MDTLIISVVSQSGNIDKMGVGETDVQNLPQLAPCSTRPSRTQKIPSTRSSSSAARVRYGKLMKVVEICTHQTLPDGKKLGKLSFEMIPDADGK